MNLRVSRLRDEIGQGKLCLKADELSRFRFSVEVDGVAIGCYAVRSIGPRALRFERAWNGSASQWDPQRQIHVAQPAFRRFHKLLGAARVVICEMAPNRDVIWDRVVLAADRVDLFDGPPVVEKSSGRSLFFECADMLGVRILDG